MTVDELVGSRVWVKSERFRNVSGTISSVETPVDRDDIRSSVVESTFKVSLTSGEVIEVPGTKIATVDREGLRDLLV
jgi:hypothetical protein